jgi:hypothetical protein
MFPLLTAHVENHPAEIDVTFVSPGTGVGRVVEPVAVPSSPCMLSPQQSTVPLVRMAQA